MMNDERRKRLKSRIEKEREREGGWMLLSQPQLGTFIGLTIKSTEEERSFFIFFFFLLNLIKEIENSKCLAYSNILFLEQKSTLKNSCQVN